MVTALREIGNAGAETGGAVPIGNVAAVAVGGIQRVGVVDVACGAGRWGGRHVRANEREAGDGVIERGRVPTLGGMAIRTISHGETASFPA